VYRALIKIFKKLGSKIVPCSSSENKEKGKIGSLKFEENNMWIITMKSKNITCRV
jgi:hypothetical protein